MKLVIAIVRSEKLDAVRAALFKIDVCVLSVTQVLGFGHEAGLTEHYRGMKVETRQPKLRLELAVSDGLVDDVVDAITRAACSGATGQVGDGKVFLMDLEHCVRIRDRATGPAATGTPLPKERPSFRRTAPVIQKQPALLPN